MEKMKRRILMMVAVVMGVLGVQPYGYASYRTGDRSEEKEYSGMYRKESREEKKYGQEDEKERSEEKEYTSMVKPASIPESRWQEIIMREQLAKAVVRNDQEWVVRLLQEDKKIKVLGFDAMYQALQHAVEKDNSVMVSVLLDNGMPVNCEQYIISETGYKPLLRVAFEKRCSIATIYILLKAGADIFAKHQGMDLLSWAAMNGTMEQVKMLLAAGAADGNVAGLNALTRMLRYSAHNSGPHIDEWCTERATIVRLLVSSGMDYASEHINISMVPELLREVLLDAQNNRSAVLEEVAGYWTPQEVKNQKLLDSAFSGVTVMEDLVMGYAGYADDSVVPHLVDIKNQQRRFDEQGIIVNRGALGKQYTSVKQKSCVVC